MTKIAKVAISLPENVLKAVEERRKRRGESRSEFFCRAVEQFLKQERESIAVKKYIQSYREMPETSKEIEDVNDISAVTLSKEPW